MAFSLSPSPSLLSPTRNERGRKRKPISPLPPESWKSVFFGLIICNARLIVQPNHLTQGSRNQTAGQQSEHHDRVEKVPLGDCAAHEVQFSGEGADKLGVVVDEARAVHQARLVEGLCGTPAADILALHSLVRQTWVVALYVTMNQGAPL